MPLRNQALERSGGAVAPNHARSGRFAPAAQRPSR
jgi:hypothetical protein